jgi:hypothetical protein
MGQTTFERENPRDMAEETTAVGRLHDVVVGASKVIYERELEESDIHALRWASQLLRVAGETHAVAAMPARGGDGA